MKTTPFAVFVSVFSLFQPAAAQGADPGFYAFVDVGRAEADRALSVAERIDSNEFSFAIGAGMSLGPHFAVQAGYHDFGDFEAIVGCPPDVFCITDTNISIVPFARDQVEVDGFSIELIGTLPLERWPVALFAKAGAVAWDTDWDANSHLDESGTDLLLGVGAAWSPVKHWTVRISYEDVDLDVSSITLGTAFNF